jgi:heme o synthase
VKVLPAAQVETLVVSRSRAIDYCELCKPRISVLVLFTVAAGAILAGRGTPNAALLVHVLIGTGLVAFGASALNQLLERHTDALMRRTENRPLPSGRLQPAEVLLFGAFLGAAGLAYLAVMVRQPMTVLVAALTFLSYVFVYTPLKRKTSLNTLIGAIPGALPPVIGWTAVTGTIGPEAIALFLILFLWQVPHFLAIAWLYREDYARAGLQMLPAVAGGEAITGRQMVSYCLVLIPASLAPAALGMTGPWYVAVALSLGIGFLVSAIAFTRGHTVERARRVVRASLIYLPVLLAALLVSGALSAAVLQP